MHHLEDVCHLGRRPDRVSLKYVHRRPGNLQWRSGEQTCSRRVVVLEALLTRVVRIVTQLDTHKSSPDKAIQYRCNDSILRFEEGRNRWTREIHMDIGRRRPSDNRGLRSCMSLVGKIPEGTASSPMRVPHMPTRI